MKKYFLLVITIIVLIGCREDAVQFSLEQSTADVTINSNPINAQIYLNNTFSGKITPDTLKNLEAGLYHLTLKLDGYKDSSTTIAVEATDDQSVFIKLNEK